MADLTPDIADRVHAACVANAQEAAAALSRALDQEMTVAVGEARHLDFGQPPAGSDESGLLVMFKFGATGALAFLPQSSGLVPDWCAEPDATGQSKLTTLAQELSMLLLPEEFMADDFKAAMVEDFGAALRQAAAASGAGLLPLTITAGEHSGELTFIWPCAQPDAAFDASAVDGAPSTASAPATAEQRAAAETARAALATPRPPATSLADLNDTEQLPAYTRSLLRIQVPVMVKLASKKQSIHQIVEIGAGSIIKFDKSCDEMLELEVAGVPIAVGEAVKVGDKFGLRISSMILPGERFEKLSRRD